MSQLDTLFVLILKFSIIAFFLLGIAVIAIRCFGQPLERIRMIQVSLGLLFVVAFAGQLGWIPAMELGWLPVDSVAIAGPKNERRVDTASENGSSAITMSPVAPATERMASTVFGSENRPPIAGNDGETETSVGETKAATFAWTWNTLKYLVVIGFASASALQGFYFMFGYLATYRLVSRASSLQVDDSSVVDEFRSETGASRVRLLVSQRISVPIATGIFRPSIVLPQQLICQPIDQLRLRHSLDHEWKHIQQRDLITWQLISLAQIVLWFQPFYWMLRKELRVSQDQLADDFATRSSDEHVEYASTLVEFSKQKTCLLGALTMAGTKSNLYRRVEMLLNAKFKVNGRSRKRIVLGFAGLTATMGILLTSIHLTQASDSTPNKITKKQEKPTETAGVDAEPAEHFGFVTDAFTKKPVSNATVIVTRMRSDTWEEIEVTESKTDETGKYTFTIPVDQLQQKYLYIMFDLRHETYAPRHCGSYSYAMLQKNQKLGADPWFQGLTMVPGERISGRFVGSDGKPVVGAAVRVRSKNESVSGFSGQSNSKTVTDNDGRFDAIVTAEGNASISVIPLEHCMKHIDLGKKRGKLDDVILTDGFSVSGIVQDALGKPMQGLWVNWRETDPEGPASYEARRSSKTDEHGRFSTRPLKTGKYSVAIETRARGALEKLKYANFGEVPPPAVFVNDTIEVTAATKDKPFVIQAVPHIYISGQCYNPQGEFTKCHLPSLTGKLNGQWMQFHSTKGERPGQFRILAPHGIKNSDLRFITNEHTGLTIQFEGKEPSPETDYRYDVIEEDITNIKVVRYVAPIVQVSLVDTSGKPVTKAVVVAQYVNEAKDAKMMMGVTQSSHFEKQENDVFRSSQLVPDIPFELIARSEGFEIARKTMTMQEADTKQVTMELKPKASEAESVE